MMDFSVVGILGPRQIGKTTLVKMIAKDIKARVLYLDLEGLPQSQETPGQISQNISA
jgi:predicted AAA+ superfamily ATPase